MNIFEKMSSLTSVTPNDEALIRFIERSPSRFLELRPKEIASEAYVSLSSLYRFACKLGFDGINALKMEVASTVRTAGHAEYIQEENTGILAESDRQTLMTLRDASMVSVFQSFLNTDAAVLSSAGELLKKAERICLFSAYVHQSAAREFQHQMQECGQSVAVPEGPYYLLSLAHGMNEKDLGILISIDGSSQTILKAGEILSLRSVPFILITRAKDHPLKNAAAAVLLLASKSSPLDGICDFAVRYALMFALDSLYLLYIRSSGKQSALLPGSQEADSDQGSFDPWFYG